VVSNKRPNPASSDPPARPDPAGGSNGPGPAPATGAENAGLCHFRLAPPRHFLYPAILLLLAEEPRHGYRLVDAVLALGFGPVDRAAVYRALADLDGDRLIESRPAVSRAGSGRHVYTLTRAGERRMADWMGIIDQERANLDRVLARYDRLATR